MRLVGVYLATAMQALPTVTTFRAAARQTLRQSQRLVWSRRPDSLGKTGWFSAAGLAANGNSTNLAWDQPATPPGGAAPSRTHHTSLVSNPPSSSLTLSVKVPSTIDQRLFIFNTMLTNTLKCLTDVLYAGSGSDFARFYVLETVARVPYFAFLSVMHLKETFGRRGPGDCDRMRAHYAEADNELHHLLIMESLGGNISTVDRAIAQACAFLYYWYVVVVYSFSEQAAYHLSELIEDHAYNSYDAFLRRHETKLRNMAVPAVAKRYYEEDPTFVFQAFMCSDGDAVTHDETSDGAQSGGSSGGEGGGFIRASSGHTLKGPADATKQQEGEKKLESLYDVFVRVRDDEREHWKTLCNLVQYDGDIHGARGAAPIDPTRPAHKGGDSSAP